MMEQILNNNLLSQDDQRFSNEVEKIDFDRNDFKTTIMDNDNENITELDQVLGEDVAWGDFDFDNNDGMDNDDGAPFDDAMVHADDFSLDGLAASDGSIDGLTYMPIVEVDDENVEQLLGQIAREENISFPTASMYPNQNRNGIEPLPNTNMHEIQPDPLLGRLSRRTNNTYINNNDNNMTSHPNRQPLGMEQMAQEVDALQRMVDDAVLNGVPRTNPTLQVPGNMNPLDLEQEKMMLLSRLNEINQRHRMTSTATSLITPTSGIRPMGSVMGGHQHPSSGIASVGHMTTTGESPLTSFLRKNQKSQAGTAAAAAAIPPITTSSVSTGMVDTSMLSRNNPLVPRAASIFAESPMQFDNPLLLESRRTKNPLLGAMDRTTASQEMVREFSARSILARSDSTGQQMRSDLVTTNNNDYKARNSAWGDSPHSPKSFKTSGILPRHASDNHMLRAATKGSLIRSRSKNSSLSRENLHYMKRSSTNGSEDSLGSLLPVKRSGGTKHKVGISRSTPRLTMHGGQGGHNGSQMNAMW